MFNENFYDFTIESNASVKNKCELTRYKKFHHYEYLRGNLFVQLHEGYEKKFKELFFMDYAPKDSFNRFLYEQLAQQKNDSTESAGLDLYLSKPENIYVLETLSKEIVINHPLVRPINNMKRLQKYKIFKNLKQYLNAGRLIVSLLDSKGQVYVKNYLHKLDQSLRDARRVTENELLEKFKYVYDKCLSYFQPLIKSKIKEISEYLYKEIKIASKELFERQKFIERLKEEDLSKNIEIKLSKDDSVVIFKYKDSSFPILNTHFEKLKKLYKINTIDKGFDNSDFNKNEFLSRAYCVISRYQRCFRTSTVINEGHGMQAALPNYTFNLLNEEFEVTQEMFASPLNCYFSQYCSAFADTDVYFGSNGSFFYYEPSSGSFQCNPPYTEEVIERMADRIDVLLAATEQPLSFIVFIPEWVDPPTPGLVKMNKSPFLKYDFIAETGKHKFISGAQFLEKSGSLFYNAAHDTHVYFLQNKAGHDKWTPTEKRVAKLKRVMMMDFECSNYSLKRKSNDKLTDEDSHQNKSLDLRALPNVKSANNVANLIVNYSIFISIETD